MSKSNSKSRSKNGNKLKTLKTLSSSERQVLAKAREILRSKGQLAGRKPIEVVCPVCREAVRGVVLFRKHIRDVHGLYYVRAQNADGTWKSGREIKAIIAEREGLKEQDKRYSNPGGRGNKKRPQ